MFGQNGNIFGFVDEAAFGFLDTAALPVLAPTSSALPVYFFPVVAVFLPASTEAFPIFFKACITISNH